MTVAIDSALAPALLDGVEFERTEPVRISTLVLASTSAFALQESVAGSLICAHGVTIYLGTACGPCKRTWS